MSNCALEIVLLGEVVHSLTGGSVFLRAGDLGNALHTHSLVVGLFFFLIGGEAGAKIGL